MLVRYRSQLLRIGVLSYEGELCSPTQRLLCAVSGGVFENLKIVGMKIEVN